MIEGGIAFGLLLYYAFEYKFTIISYLFTFFWGISDSGVNCMLNVIMANEFNSKILPFGVLKFVQSLCIFFSMIIESNIRDPYWYIIYFICAGIIAFVA